MKRSRRRFLLAGVGAVGLLVLTGISARYYCREFVLTGRANLADQLALTFANSATAARVGHAYLALNPVERDPKVINRKLEDRFATVFGDIVCPVTAAHILAKAARRDFVDEDVVELSGWLMARSEARVCAYIAVRDSYGLDELIDPA